MEKFDLLGLPEELLVSLKAMRFDVPTPIQAQAIPPALLGRDILGSAQTGTGKTAAYGIPLVAHLLKTNGSALVITPTRELASQVLAALQQMLGRNSGIGTALLIGGADIHRQLRNNPRLIVGTPGRINDHLDRGNLNMRKVDFFVLDEADRMMDMGFTTQLEQIVQQLPERRQTLMFSATFVPSILRMAEKYLNNAVRVAVGVSNSPVSTIKQEVVRTSQLDKYAALLEQLNKFEGSVIIFVRTKIGSKKLADKLYASGHDADAIHGDLRQNKREQVIKNFKNFRKRILVATDVASRGLDIAHVSCVINFDMPDCAEDFVHRIGRTGRAGAEGWAVSLLTEHDNLKWRNICRLINPVKKPEQPMREAAGNRF